METEKKTQATKEWKTPELIVLVRSNPEEAVLADCKSLVGESDGPLAYNGQCRTCRIGSCVGRCEASVEA